MSAVKQAAATIAKLIDARDTFAFTDAEVMALEFALSLIDSELDREKGG